MPTFLLEVKMTDPNKGKMPGKKYFGVELILLLVSAYQILLVLLVLIVVGAGVFAFEGFGGGKHDFWLALYTSFITALTIGYGDMTPDGVWGMISAVILGIVGMIFMGVVIAATIKALERSGV
jgi:hypothetical protein